MSEAEQEQTTGCWITSSQYIIEDMNKYIPHNMDSQHWYVGITDNPQRRFYEHNIKDHNWRRCYKSESWTHAQQIEKLFVNRDNYPTKGDSGGGIANSRYVYVYFRAPNTKP